MPDSNHEAHEILLTRWFEEIWNKKNYDLAEKLVDPGFVHRGDGSQELGRGLQGALEPVKTWQAAFPAGRMTLEDVITEGDRSVYRVTFRGKHTGALGDFPASGRTVVLTCIGVDRIAGGKILESWGDLNLQGLMQQVGALPWS
jgi:predicted ester cyclase